MPIRVQCGDPAFDALPEAVEEWLRASSLCAVFAGETVNGYRAGKQPLVALCDHSFSLWAGAFFQSDVRSALNLLLRAPLPDGSLFDAIRPLPCTDAATFPHSFDDLPRQVRLQRHPLNASSESHAVLATYRAWQASGDNSWLLSHLPVLVRALEYSMRHPHRWSSELELPKRAFTLDGWPLAYEGAATLQDDMRWCVHPGDAAWLHAACVALSKGFAAVGQASDEELWKERAAHLEAQLNSVGWNGQWYTHQIHLVPVRLRGVDEARQLAACNAFVMNAGIASQEQCASILREYSRRRELNLETSFCEWWSIQPPFPAETFGEAPGTGANGACWPLVGGELARAALGHGWESYGVEMLRRYYELAVKPRRSWAWYALDGTAGRDEESVPHDSAGASAMLRALVEGVCGIRDEGKLFERITLAPRWPATGQNAAHVEVSYAGNPAYVSYRWALDGGRMTLDYESKAKHVSLDILLPRGNTPERVALNGRTHEYSLVTLEKSKYVRLETERKRGAVAITLK